MSSASEGSIVKMVGIALAFAAAGGAIGGLLGAGLGYFTPDLYRVWFPPDPLSTDPQPNPLQLGIGLGIIQGFILGIVLACVVLIVSALRARKPE